jgi:hypothetical protein
MKKYNLPFIKKQTITFDGLTLTYFIEDKVLYFNIRELSVVMKYCRPSYLYDYYCKSQKYCKVIDKTYIDYKNLKIMLSRTTKHNTDKITKMVDDLYNDLYDLYDI